MSGSDLPKGIRLTKNEAALRQTMAAIEMYLQGRYECAVTLAGAAEGMVPKSENSMHQAHLTREVPESLRHTEYAALDKTGRNRFWNEQRDWLKHTGDSHPPSMSIIKLDAESMISRAITHLPAEIIMDEHKPIFRAFFESYIPDWPKLFASPPESR
jgi:hypothetical protein